ncbi:thiol reductant ABC exporter subunit CydC [Amnibacterium flavum]|uniref:Thiol reductant ABC exporter subunit CydC n=1 Tax=Amnibacterium flavum TaxID=2173173 RepID=A0A2V1HUT4_9MICO|nr:thiol reductant ABC exporter subunit CydC [Amnibacterium flavum]PVZ94067.1 thiol reductant ABC exporter subunit CydC [Amnibacterium flavum]
MRSPFAAGLGPGGTRTLYLLGLISAVKALGLLGIAEALAVGISSLFDGSDAWRGAVALGLGSALVRAGASWLAQWFATRAAIGAKETLRAELAESLIGQPGVPVGEATALATRGLDDLDPYYRTVLPSAVGAAVIPLAVGARILLADPLSALIVALTVPLIPVFMILIGQYTRDRVDEAAGALSRLSDHLVELARGLPVLVGLGRVEEQTVALERISDQYRVRTLATLRIAFLSALALELIATLSVAIVAVTVGIRLIGGDMTLYTGLLVLILAPECYTPLREVGVAFHASQDGVAALERVRAAIGRVRPSIPASGDSDAAANGALVVTDLTVRYLGRDAAAVQDLSFAVLPGETVALTGRSGSGKSTVVRALVGRLDETDGASGTIAGTDRVAWAPQHPRTLARTVRAELRSYGPGVPESRIGDLLDRFGLGALADADPVALSPGELRRVAVIRALLRVDEGADLVVLDEPTAHLDAQSARRVETAIGELHGRVRVVLVSHDPRVIGLADRAIDVSDGAEAREMSSPAMTDMDHELLSTKTARSEDAAAAPLSVAATGVLLAGLLRPVAGRLVAALLLGALAALSAAALTAVSGWLIVRAAQEPAIMYLLVAIVGVRFFGIARSVLRYAERLVTHDAVFGSITTLRTRLWRAISRRGTASPALLRAGSAYDVLVVTADEVRDLAPRVIIPPLVGAATAVAALMTAALLHAPALGLYAAAILIALFVAPAVAVLADRRASSGQVELRGRIARRLASALGAADDLRANGVDGPVLADLRDLDRRAGLDARRSSWALGLGGAITVAALTGAAIGVLAVCAPAVAGGQVGVEIVAVLALLPLGLIDPMLALVEAVQQAPALVTALRRLAPVLEDAAAEDARAGDAVGNVESVRVENLSARWSPTGPIVFEGLDASVQRGQWLAVTGPSGSGKTTLLSVLLRYLDPAAGRYLVDGRDALALDRAALRGRIAWCPQEAHLFASTIRGNLLLARGRDDRPGDDEMRDALGRVGLTHLVEGMTDGLDTMVGGGGSSLSGGERQRLAVARTLLSRADVVLLDEPTAHLDAETADAMMADLRSALEDRAVVLVSHRADDLRPDDRRVRIGQQAAILAVG